MAPHDVGGLSGVGGTMGRLSRFVTLSEGFMAGGRAYTWHWCRELKAQLNSGTDSAHDSRDVARIIEPSVMRTFKLQTEMPKSCRDTEFFPQIQAPGEFGFQVQVSRTKG